MTPTTDANQFFRKNSSQVYAFVLSQGVPFSDASDVSQNVFLRLTATLERFDMTRAMNCGGDVTAVFNGWVSRQIMWTCRDYFKAEHRRTRKLQAFSLHCQTSFPIIIDESDA